MNGMKRAAVLLLLVLSLYGLAPVEALSITGLTVSLTCSGFTYSDFTYTFDRNNTGAGGEGSEAFQIIVKDSADNVIHLAGGTVTLGTYTEGGASASYNLGTAVPGAVTYQWISQAGNGFEEQVAFSYTGYCGDAPTATPSPTPAPTATPGPSPTPTPTITPTPNVSDVYDVGGTPVLIVREVTPGDVATIGLLALIAGLLMVNLLIKALESNEK